MFSAISLLVLVCAITINAQNNPKCSKKEVGYETSHEVKFQPVPLTPNIRDWIVRIPPVAECVQGVAGVKAFICDYDKPPTGQFTDYNTLQVHRTGELKGYGSVTITVYCIV